MTFSSYPIDGPFRVTSKYGPRNTGIAGASTFHKGIDIGRDFSKPSTNVLSVKAGTVSFCGWNKYRGWYIIIKHSDEVSTLYQHLASMPKLKVGDRVRAGQVLGVMGNSSDKAVLSVAVHLHFEVQVNGKPVDPAPYFLHLEEEVTSMTEKELREFVTKIVKEIMKGSDTKVSAWAKDTVSKAKEMGITDGTRPGGTATREEVVTMIVRAVEK